MHFTKEIQSLFFFFLLLICYGSNLGMFVQIKMVFACCRFSPKENMLKKGLFCILSPLLFFLLFFFYHSEAYRKSCMKLKKNAKLEDDGEREVFFCLFKKKRNHKITEADQQKRVLYFWYKFAVFFLFVFPQSRHLQKGSFLWMQVACCITGQNWVFALKYTVNLRVKILFIPK